jgi:hypothetical protein
MEIAKKSGLEFLPPSGARGRSNAGETNAGLRESQV